MASTPLIAITLFPQLPINHFFHLIGSHEAYLEMGGGAVFG